MKKFLFAIAILCIFSATTYAQTSKVKIGAKAGINISDIYSGAKTDVDESVPGFGSISAKNEMKIGVNAGILAEFFLSKRFSIQPEILYSDQGVISVAKTEMTVGKETINESKTIKSNFNYLNVPVMFKFYIVDGLNIHLGPQIGFLLKDSTHEKATSVTTKEDGTKDVKDIPDVFNDPYESKYKASDLGFNFGLGYATPEGLFIDARYNLGMSNILKNVSDDEKLSLKHRVIQVSIGFKF